MLKFTITIKEKDGETSTVTLKGSTQAEVDKATKGEKQTAGAVYETISKALQELKN